MTCLFKLKTLPHCSLESVKVMPCYNNNDPKVQWLKTISFGLEQSVENPFRQLLPMLTLIAGHGLAVS